MRSIHPRISGNRGPLLDDPDRARERRALGEHAVAAGRQVVAPRGRDLAERDHSRAVVRVVANAPSLTVTKPLRLTASLA